MARYRTYTIEFKRQVAEEHLPAYLDEHVFRFNRRTAERISHGFARLIEQAVRTKPSTYRAIVTTPA